MASSSKVLSKSNSTYQKPGYHWEGFGRKSTKPSWYDVYALDHARKPVHNWEGESCGVPRVQNKEAVGRPPFVHETSQRNSPLHTGANVIRGSTPSFAAHRDASYHSYKQMEANRQAANTSELSKTLYGKSRPLERPILYPANVNHDMALVLEKKVGPGPTWDKRVEQRDTPYQWDQKQYIAFSRTRSDFQNVKQMKQPAQPL